MELMDSNSHDSAGHRSNKLPNPVRRFRVDGIKQASRLKESRRRLVLEAVMKVAVIVLVNLGVNDDRMIDSGLTDKLRIRFHGLGWRTIRRVLVIWKVLLIVRKQVRGIYPVAFGWPLLKRRRGCHCSTEK